jgi:hypothetical protein
MKLASVIWQQFEGTPSEQLLPPNGGQQGHKRS